ncbi:MAG: thioredoxin family protein, partial [Bdellovibrionales bacterium]|nr:thioredoxin family protein [Bdellovibrionales bacterium]
IMIDFRADWCAACKELEAFTFSDTTVQAEASQFIILQVDATSETEENTRIRQKFKIMGLPTILFYSPTGNPREDLTLTGFESASQFLERLKRTRENR